MVDNHNDPAATHAAPNPGVLIADHYNRAFGYTTRRPRGPGIG
ncbi:hypothetical protein N6H14_03295 [Paenibacillus sp. CC-CFT747]|nr:hypothetical protein N6H14_03295 [Paenibacillus sp. CC-CFT747]